MKNAQGGLTITVVGGALKQPQVDRLNQLDIKAVDEAGYINTLNTLPKDKETSVAHLKGNSSAFRLATTGENVKYITIQNPANALEVLSGFGMILASLIRDGEFLDLLIQEGISKEDLRKFLNPQSDGSLSVNPTKFSSDEELNSFNNALEVLGGAT